MRRLGAGVKRLVAWLILAVVVTVTLYQVQLVTFFDLLNGRLEDNFGTTFSALPFAGLLAALFLIRWRDFSSVLSHEGGPRSRPLTRALGVATAALPVAPSRLFDPSLELSAAALVAVFYGTSLVVNPTTARFLLPYAGLYEAGVTAPFAIQSNFGEPLVGLATALTSWMTSLAGFPVIWDGPEFQVVSSGGELVAAVITPGCSSVLSVTTFLGLLGLMHLDQRKKFTSTLALAGVGVVALVFLNSLRISLLIWAGLVGGSPWFWSLHNWVGYAVFIGFYLVFLVAYSRLEGPRPSSVNQGLDHVQPEVSVRTRQIGIGTVSSDWTL